jgi:hypothetical protein
MTAPNPVDHATLQAGAAYECFLAGCAPLRWPPPWDFLGPDPDCFAPVGDAGAALARLRAGFGDRLLRQAGLLEAGPTGAPRLGAALCDPGGAVVALRRGPGQAPFDLLTAQGCASGARLPALAALEDARALDGLRAGRPLLAGPAVAEVALLRALGFPATLTAGLDRADLGQLRALAAAFGAAADGAGQDAPPSTPPGARLALLGWAPMTLRVESPAALAPAAARLSAACEHLGLELYRAYVWQPVAESLEALSVRLDFRDAGLVRESLETSLKYDLGMPDDFADPGAEPGPPPPPADFAAAQAALLKRLAEGRREGGLSDAARDDLRAYEDLARRDLVAPLQSWALAQPDPVLRNAGAELARVCAALHLAAPLLHELQARELELALEGRGGAAHPLLAQYARLATQVASLFKTLCRAREAR